MSDAPGTVQAVLRVVRRVVSPLADRLTVGAAPAFFGGLGVPMTAAQATSLAGPLGAAGGAVANHVRSVDELDQLLDAGDLSGLLTSTANAIGRVADLFDALPALGTAVGGLPGAPPGFAATFPQRLLDHLITDFIGSAFGANEVLEFLGILDRQDLAIPGPGGMPYTVDTLHLDRVADWVGDPAGQLAARFDWGAPGFDGTRLLEALAQLLGMLGMPALIDRSGPAPVLDMAFASIAPHPEMAPAGVGLTLDGGSAPVTFEASGTGWALTASVEFGLPSGAEVILQPDGAVSVRLPQGSPAVTGRVRLTFTVTRPGDSPVVLFGTPGGSRLEAREVAFEFDAGLRWDATGAHGDAGIGGVLRQGKLVLDLGEGDGFLASLLSGARVENDFELGFGFSLDGGLRLHGSSALEVQLPAHVTLGPVELTALTLSARLSPDRVPILLTADLKAALGPLTAAVQGVGVGATLALASGNQGNLGPIDLSLAFQPPKGVGLALDTGLVTGGGFLFLDPEAGEYAGALELELAGFIEVKAIGLITTRMPDGTSGFSLLIIMTAEFGGGGIQLGYGFTLLAVGGLIGLNRRMNLQALVEGVRAGRTESVMFPRDVVANAPRIISDLRAFFPPEQGTFLIGPMAKIGWGTPTLVSVSLGVIIEIPGNIAILGILKCVLPTQQLPLLVLQVDFIGALEFDKSRLWFFAQLFESRILMMTIDGGMGLLIGWGDNPDLVLTVGGFHPSFKPPPLPFPVPARLSVDIINQPNLLIRVSGYFAITSNTVQFGARAELRLGFDDFGVQGHLAFDALFRFSPFAFVISVSASVTLKAFGVGLFGIDLRFQLEGPAPWRAHGRGSISLLFFEISADFDFSWGEAHNTTLPPVAVLPLLAAEIAKSEGWETRLPGGSTKALVNLRTLPDSDDLVLHPLGALFIRQRALPLNVRLDRIGAQRPSDGKRFTVEPVPGSGLARRSLMGDKFPMAQFQDMDDAAKLSRPAYEEQDAGLELAPEQGALASPRVVRRSTRYEMSILDSGPRPRPTALARAAAGEAVTAAVLPPGPGPVPARTSRFQSVSTAVYGQLLAGSSTSRSPLSQVEARRRQPFAADETVQVTAGRFAIAQQRNNRQAYPPRGANTAVSFRSQAAADDALAAWIAADPSLAGTLHVLPEAEASAPLTPAGTWAAAAPAPTGATGAGAVRLANGKVLVAGGADGTGAPLAAAALFDPVSATWTAAPSLAAARRDHSLTLLDDGRVLAAGGSDVDGAPLASAELYDPVANAWSTTGALHTARAGHSATLLVTGQVLVAGGSGARGTAGSGTLASAELFDPAGTWDGGVAPMTDARAGHRAVTLPDGRVLVVGGRLATGRGETPLAWCEAFAPADGSWTPAASLAMPRAGHEATVLPGGTVLVTGGEPAPATVDGRYLVGSLPSAERYDHVADRWTAAAVLPGARAHHRAIPLRTGRVLLTGGTGASAATGLRGATGYDPAGGGSPTGALAVGRWDHTAVELADGRVLVTGGTVAAGAAAPGPEPATVTATTEIFTP